MIGILKCRTELFDTVGNVKKKTKQQQEQVY